MVKSCPVRRDPLGSYSQPLVRLQLEVEDEVKATHWEIVSSEAGQEEHRLTKSDDLVSIWSENYWVSPNLTGIVYML